MTFLTTTFASGAPLDAAVSTTNSEDFVALRLDVFMFCAIALAIGVGLFQLLRTFAVARRGRRRGWNERRRRAYWKKNLGVCAAWEALFLFAFLGVAATRPATKPLYTITIARISSGWIVSDSEELASEFVCDDRAPLDGEKETASNAATVCEVSNAGDVHWSDAVDRRTNVDSQNAAPSLDDKPKDEVVFIPFVKNDVVATEARELPAEGSKTTAELAPTASNDARTAPNVSQPIYHNLTPAFSAGSTTSTGLANSTVASRVDLLLANFAPVAPLLPYPDANRNVRSIPNSLAVRAATVEQATYVERPSVAFAEDAAEEASLLVRIDEEFSRVSARVKRSVLPIETRKYSNNATKKIEEETGCGFLVQYKNRIFLITNRHVVADAVSQESVKVFLPNKTAVSPIKIMNCVDFDLAVLELNRDDLPTDGSVALCYFGDSDELEVANFVGTVGNPFGLRDTVTYGHVSSLRRRNLPLSKTTKNSLQEYIQIDASINPGNSGGPLYNSRGEVVGVVTAIATTSGKNEGVAFAIPINLALQVVKTTIDAGGWSRSHMGVELAPATRGDFGENVSSIVFGSKIVRIQSNSPAERAGFQQGDLVLEFNGETVEDDVHLARLIAMSSASETATLRVSRGGRVFEVKTGFAPGKVAE